MAHRLANFVLNRVATKRYCDAIAELVQLGRDVTWEQMVEESAVRRRSERKR